MLKAGFKVAGWMICDGGRGLELALERGGDVGWDDGCDVGCTGGCGVGCGGI